NAAPAEAAAIAERSPTARFRLRLDPFLRPAGSVPSPPRTRLATTAAAIPTPPETGARCSVRPGPDRRTDPSVRGSPLSTRRASRRAAAGVKIHRRLGALGWENRFPGWRPREPALPPWGWAVPRPTWARRFRDERTISCDGLLPGRGHAT